MFAVFLAFFLGPWAKESHDPTSSPSQPTRPYHVVDIPGKGRGVIAIRDITHGELLYRESPLFVVPNQSTRHSPLVDMAEANQGLIS